MADKVLEGSMDMLIEIMKKNQSNDYFNCLAITAPQREGKSTLARQIAIKMFPEFTYEGNYIGNPKQRGVFDAIAHSPKKYLHWIDEGETVFSSDTYWDRQQIDLQKLFNQFASENKTIIICTPRFKKIDLRWRELHISYWIKVICRGYAVLLERKDMEASNDVWGLDNTKEEEEKITVSDMRDPDKVLRIYAKNPCTRFFLRFNDWASQDEKDEYTKWKEKSQQDFKDITQEKNQMEEEKENRHKIGRATKLAISRFVAFQHIFAGNSLETIGKMVGLNRTTLSGYLKWFEDGVYSGAIREEELIGGYFTKGNIAAIRNRAGTRVAKELPTTSL